MGEELSVNSLPRSRLSNQFQEVSSFFFSDVLLSWHDDREPGFESFPDAGMSAETSIADRRISVLQAAKRRLLEQPVGPAFLSLLACSRVSPPYEVPPAVVAGSVGFPGRVGFGRWTPSNALDLFWWSDFQNFLTGVSLEPCLPDLLFWFDSSVLGCGANLVDQFVSGVWSAGECKMSINWRDLRPIHMGLFHFRESLQGKSLGLFYNNTIAVTCLKKQGGMFLQPLDSEAQLLLRWTESMGITLLSQFIMEAKNLVADSLSCCHQVLGLEWTLTQEVVDDLWRMWLVTINLFATSFSFCLQVYSPLNNPLAAGTDAFLQDWNGLQAYAFPPFALVCQVLAKLQSCRGTEPSEL